MNALQCSYLFTSLLWSDGVKTPRKISGESSLMPLARDSHIPRSSTVSHKLARRRIGKWQIGQGPIMVRNLRTFFAIKKAGRALWRPRITMSWSSSDGSWLSNLGTSLTMLAVTRCSRGIQCNKIEEILNDLRTGAGPAKMRAEYTGGLFRIQEIVLTLLGLIIPWDQVLEISQAWEFCTPPTPVANMSELPSSNWGKILTTPMMEQVGAVGRRSIPMSSKLLRKISSSCSDV